MAINRETSLIPGTAIGGILIRALESAGEVCEGREPPYNFLRNRAFMAETVAPSGQVYVAKLGDHALLATEFANQQTAHRCFSDVVPRPVQLHREEDISVFLMTGLALSPMSPHEPFFALDGGAKSMAEFLIAAHHAFPVEADDRVVADLAAEFLHKMPDASRERIDRYLSDTKACNISDLQHSRQHGDLAINNLGTCDGQLTVLDWEDYGIVSMPGFDLALFVGSCFNHDPVTWKKVKNENADDPLTTLVHLVTTGIDLDPDIFFRLLPLYYLLFLKLKVDHGYGASIQKRILNFLNNY